MRRTIERLECVGWRRATLLLAVVALVAAAVQISAREAGLNLRGEAEVVAQQGQAAPAFGCDEDADECHEADEAVNEVAGPLHLVLIAPEICDAHHPSGGKTTRLVWDETAQAWNRVIKERWWTWSSMGTMEVLWAASGGDGDYTIALEQETYSGANGIAEVSCALEHGPIIQHPRRGRILAFEHKPVVDAGIKTVRATVTDGSGTMAEASVDVYAVLNPHSEDVLRGGATYRLWSWLLTVPDGVEALHGSTSTPACERVGADGSVNTSVSCEESFDVGLEGPGYSAWLALGMKSGKEINPARNRWVSLDDPRASGAAEVRRQAHLALDQLAASVGQPPRWRSD